MEKTKAVMLFDAWFKDRCPHEHPVKVQQERTTEKTVKGYTVRYWSPLYEFLSVHASLIFYNSC